MPLTEKRVASVCEHRISNTSMAVDTMLGVSISQKIIIFMFFLATYMYMWLYYKLCGGTEVAVSRIKCSGKRSPELVHLQIIPFRGATPMMVFGHQKELRQLLSCLLQHFVTSAWSFGGHPVPSDAQEFVLNAGLFSHLVHVHCGV